MKGTVAPSSSKTMAAVACSGFAPISPAMVCEILRASAGEISGMSSVLRAARGRGKAIVATAGPARNPLTGEAEPGSESTFHLDLSATEGFQGKVDSDPGFAPQASRTTALPGSRRRQGSGTL